MYVSSIFYSSSLSFKRKREGVTANWNMTHQSVRMIKRVIHSDASPGKGK